MIERLAELERLADLEDWPGGPADAALIAETRNALPALLAIAKALDLWAIPTLAVFAEENSGARITLGKCREALAQLEALQGDK